MLGNTPAGLGTKTHRFYTWTLQQVFPGGNRCPETTCQGPQTASWYMSVVVFSSENMLKRLKRRVSDGFGHRSMTRDVDGFGRFSLRAPVSSAESRLSWGCVNQSPEATG